MHEEMRSAKMIDDALRVFKTERYSRFQKFDDALNALTRKLYEREYYNTPNSSICIFYNPIRFGTHLRYAEFYLSLVRSVV